MPRIQNDYENIDYPLAYRLAQFLLGAGESVGQYGQGMAKQSAQASDILETNERQRLAGEENKRRNRETDINEQKFMLEYLVGKKKAPPSTIAPGHGVLNETGGYDVPVPLKSDEPKFQFRNPAYDVMQGDKVLIPGTPPAKEPPAPPTPSPERDWHAVVEEMMPNASPGAKAQKVRELSEASQTRVQTAAQAGALKTQQTMLDMRDRKERALKADEAMAEMGQVDAILGRIDQLIPKVNTGGLGGRLAGLTSRPAQQFLQTDENINEMSALSTGYVSVIAKIVQRQSGILSNQDLARAESAVPQIGDNTEVAMRKSNMLKFLRDKAKRNAERLRTGLDPEDTQPPMELEGSTAPPGFKPR